VISPITVLPSRRRVQVQDRVETMLRAQVDHPVQMSKPILLEHARIQVILEVAIIESNTDAVETQRCEEGSIFLREEVLQEL
jgi:hypothetical protein